MQSTPWPIETHSHPISSLAEQRRRDKPILDDVVGPSSMVDMLKGTYGNIISPIVFDEDAESMDRAELIEACFQRPQFFRDQILNDVRVTPVESFRNKGTFYAWLNKSCPVGCDFCFFRSPTKAQTEIPSGDKGIGKLIKFVNDANMERLFISGGGEPMLKRNDVNRIAREINVDRMIVVTSGYFACKSDGALKAVTELRENLASNPNKTAVTLRLSLDKCHAEKLGSRGRGGLSYVHNLIDAFKQTSTGKGDRLSFLIHTMMDDNTVETLLSELPVKSREDSGPEFKRRTHVVLEDGYAFDIEYAQIFQSNTDVDMKSEEARHNIDAFEKYVTHRANGNMTLSHNAHGVDASDQPKGVDWLVLYDGTATHWSSTVPDNEPNIYTDTFDEAMQRHLDDVITLALLEKGTFYRDNIVAEANPQAVARARAIGLRDQYTRVLFEEDGTRLYTSLRVIQDYIADGRISHDQIAKWPKVLQVLVSTPKEILAKACRTSKHDILDQYLIDPKISTDKLRSLYKMVRLGHYKLSPPDMIERVMRSSIDASIKHEFAICVWTCPHAVNFVSQFQTADQMVDWGAMASGSSVMNTASHS